MTGIGTRGVGSFLPCPIRRCSDAARHAPKYKMRSEYPQPPLADFPGRKPEVRRFLREEEEAMKYARFTISARFLLLALFIGTGACHKTMPSSQSAAPPPALPPPAPTITLNADRTSITPGQAVTLTWRSTNATDVTIDGGMGAVQPNGNRQISPTASIDYTARAIGAGGTAVSEIVRISVIPAPPPRRETTSASIPSSSNGKPTMETNALRKSGSSWSTRASARIA
jgi:hypothetical protein